MNARVHRRRRGGSTHGARRGGYLLLETVIATGLLIIGIAVIGSQVSEAEKSVRQMRREMRGMLLAEQYIAELDLGLIELDSLDEIQEDDFGPRYPDFGWRLRTEETAIDGVFLLTFQVLHHFRDDYESEEFDFDNAEIVYEHHLIRATPQPVDLATEFGLTEDEVEELSEKLANTGIDGLTANNFDPKILAKVDSEQLMAVLPILLEAFGQNVDQLMAQLPPEVAEALRQSGVLPEKSESPTGQTGQNTGSRNAGNENTGPRDQSGQPSEAPEE